MTPADLQDLADGLAAGRAVPGLVTGVLTPDGRVTASAGVLSAAAPLPVDVDTLFFIGSTTKTLTATALMTQVEGGRLDLSDPVVRHLPELRLSDAEAREVLTVGQLLDHTGGWRGDGVVDTGWGDDALERALHEGVRSEPQVTPPGHLVSYNNSAFLVAGRLLERLTGAPYDRAVGELVLQPLGMSSTSFLPWQVAGRSLAVGHVLGDGPPEPVLGWPLTRATAPAGGAVSTMADQLTWARWCLDGTTTGRSPLSDSTRLLMQQRRAECASAITGVGLSWLLQRRGDLDLVTHGGNVSNLHVGTFVLAPARGIAVLALSSSRGGMPAGQELVDVVLRDVAGVTDVALPVQPLPADTAGWYDAGAWQVELRTEGPDTVLLERVLPPDTPDVVRTLFAQPPLRLRHVGGDRFATEDRPHEVAADLGRDDAGDVVWLRWGMRVHPRLRR